MKKSLLRLSVAAIALTAAAPAFAQSAPAPVQAEAPEPEAVATVDEVVVTGSRIRRVDLEGVAPVSVLTGEAIDTRGFRSVFDALSQATQNTGSVQGEDFGATFTPAANVISLRGLGPNHTLVLLNGRRVAEYPSAYNGSVNAVNLANLPNAVVDRIEVLTGGAGAIYGSDAIAGVVNIKLKQKTDGFDASLRYGGTEQGGGENWRAQLSGGRSWDRLDVVGSLEYSQRDAIFWGDREISESYTRYAEPGAVPPAMFSNRNPITRAYYDPPAGLCEGLGALQGGTIERVVAASGGSYCGSDAYYSTRTIQTQKESGNAYLGLTYHLNDDTEVFGEFLYGKTQVDNVVRSLSWNKTFWNDTAGRLETWNRVLTPEETGGAFGVGNRYDEENWNAVLGVRGYIGDWRYEAAFNRSEYVSDQSRVRLLTGIDAFFLGAQQGTRDVAGTTQPVYAPAANRLYTPLTSGEFGAVADRFTDHNTSWLQDFTLSVDGDLWQLPAGTLQAAAVVEIGEQGYKNQPDARLNNGIAWNTSGSQPSGGERKRQAAGLELRVPILDQLTATVAGRYDRYEYRGESVDSPTYSLGLQYRPIPSLMLRSSYSTSFRAPDMNYIFATETRGYYPGVTDYYQCRLEGQDYSSCDIQYNMDFTRGGNAELQPEKGKSFTAGFVWTPSKAFDLQFDYYDLEISQQVTSLSEDIILRTEADCRIGRTPSGGTVDPTSALCLNYVGRVARNPGDAAINPNQVTRITVNPINAASETTRGFDATVNARHDFERYGRLSGSLTYTKVLEHEYQQFEGDPTFDYLRDLSRQSDWRDRMSGSVTWDVGPWTTTLYGVRYGTIPTNDYASERDPYAVFNASIRYRVNDKASVSVIMNNIADRYPKDRTGGWPNYSIGWYDIYGRQTWVQLDYSF